MTPSTLGACMVTMRARIELAVFLQKRRDDVDGLFGRLHLAAHSPHDHARVVAVAVNHLARGLGLNVEILLGVIDFLADEQFVEHEQAEAIAGVHHRGVVRIVAGAEKIAAHLADVFHVFDVPRIGEGISHAGIGLMPGGSTQLQTLAVQKEALVGIETEPAEAQGNVE